MISKINSWFNKPNFGLLLARIIISAWMLQYALTHIIEGTKAYKVLGKVFISFGLPTFPMLWGVLAVIIIAAGSILILLGLLYRPICFLFFLVFLVGTSLHLFHGAKILLILPVAQYMLLSLALLCTGAGKFSIDKA